MSGGRKEDKYGALISVLLVVSLIGILFMGFFWFQEKQARIKTEELYKGRIEREVERVREEKRQIEESIKLRDIKIDSLQIEINSLSGSREANRERSNYYYNLYIELKQKNEEINNIPIDSIRVRIRRALSRAGHNEI